jgi:predicted nucleic acid-binding protein
VKYLLDTNVYLEATRSEANKSRFRSVFFPLLPATFLSAVVAYELMVNVRDTETGDLLQAFVRPFVRTGRIVAPTFADWGEAARVVAAMWKSEKGQRSKLPALLNDVLIALCARQIGATLLTYNRDDFLLIKRHLDFSLRAMTVQGAGSPG